MKALWVAFAISLATFCLPGNAHALCVKVNKANLRTGPGTKHDISWEAHRYTPLQKITSKGNWFKVRDVDGVIHWIYKNLVTDAYLCATIKAQEANVRKGPGTKHDKLFLWPKLKYESFKYIRRKGKWVQIEDPVMGKGWIYGPLVWVY